MTWGKSKPQPPPSTLSQILPLLITLIILSLFGFVGYQIYLSATKIGEKASEKMGSKNVVFTKDGLRVGVKQVETESYVDATQSWVVKAWNLGSDAKKEEAAANKKARKGW